MSHSDDSDDSISNASSSLASINRYSGRKNIFEPQIEKYRFGSMIKQSKQPNSDQFVLRQVKFAEDELLSDLSSEVSRGQVADRKDSDS